MSCRTHVNALKRCALFGMLGFPSWGGGGGASIEPPKWGGGGGKRAQLTDAILTNEKVRIHVF